MNHSVFFEPQFHNEESAFAFVEALLWPNGPVCPHCGGKEKIGKLNGEDYPDWPLQVLCVSQSLFTVRIGTIFEDSHIPLRFWLQAIYYLWLSPRKASVPINSIGALGLP